MNAHPTDRTLHAYGLGKLDDASAESVNSHLEGCPDCRQRVAALTADSFLGRLRDAKVQPPSQGPAVSSTAGLSLLDGGVGSVAPPPASTLPPGLADHPDYEILRELGRGGMGVVYLAQNKLMGRKEVLKVVGGHLVSRPAILERFLREIRSAARLHHPNIVTAYTTLRLGESLVLAMEYVEGLDLARLVKAKGPLPVAKACNYVHQAALGLQHAHEHGMVHRDIKPANLILAASGNKAIIKVLDFGLAKITSEGQRDTSLTREGQMLGTPDYIAPEQIRDAQSADIRADIYSLGCTLYSLLSGRPPFTGDNLWDIYQAHFSMDATPLNLARPEVPVELAALVAKMMAKDPGRRFQEPMDVAQALKLFFRSGGGGPVVARPDVSLASPSEVKPQRAAPALEETEPAEGTSPASMPAGRRQAKTNPGSILEGLIDLGEPEPLRDRLLDGPGTLVTPTPIRKVSSAWSTIVGGLNVTSPPRRWAIAVVLLIGLIIVGAAVILRLKTRDGVIVLEDLPEQAEVYVDEDRAIVSWPGGGLPAEISVPPGRHGVQAKMGGFTTFGDKVTIDAGERRRVKIRLERLGATATAGGETAGASQPAEPRSPGTIGRTLGEADRDVSDRPPNVPSPATAARSQYTESAGRWEVDGGELVQSDLTKWYSSLMFGDERWTDYDFTVDAMRTGGQNSFSLFFRSTDRSHGFEYRVAGEGNKICRVEHNEDHHATSLGEAFAARLENGRWYTARVHVRGGHFACSLYDCEAAREVGRLDVEDGRHPKGRVGLGTFLSSYRFKNIRVTDPDGHLLWEGPPAVDPVKLVKENDSKGAEKAPGTIDSAAEGLEERGGKQDGYVPLFNGIDLRGWQVDRGDPDTWHVRDGVLIGDGAGDWRKMTFLLSEHDYTDFILRFEFQLPKNTDSGVVLRARPGENHIELNLRNFADPPGSHAQTAALHWSTSGRGVDYLPPDRPAELGSDAAWHEMTIEFRGSLLRASINRRQVRNTDLRNWVNEPTALPALKHVSGRIGFQSHTGTVRFRNIEIKELFSTGGPQRSAPGRARHAMGIDAQLPVGSIWKGWGGYSRPANYPREITVALTITKREGNEFEAIYRGDKGRVECQVKGTISGDSIQWKVTKSLRGLVDFAESPFAGTIAGDRINVELEHLTFRGEPAHAKCSFLRVDE